MTKENILKALFSSGEKLKEKSVTIGFDGYIDTIYTVIKNRFDQENFTEFQTIREFGKYIEENNLSCDIEIKKEIAKIGGNAPIMANAMSAFGLYVNCIGAFGKPKLSSVFEAMRQKCNLISVEEPAITTALEFENGKIMLGDIDSLNRINWDVIKNSVDSQKLINIFSQSSLIAITNWSQMIHSNDILEGLCSETLPYIGENKGRYIFFDIADPSRRSTADIASMLDYIKQFRNFGRTILGLNLKESKIIYKNLYEAEPEINEIEYIASKINEKLNIAMVVIHSSASSAICSGKQVSTVKSLIIEKTSVLTGSGDNFNSGLCLGLLLELCPTEILTIATAAAAFYIANGRSASIDEIGELIKKEF